MKRQVLLISFNLLVFLCLTCNTICQTKLKVDLRYTYPICVNHEANSYLLNILNLTKDGTSGFSFGLTAISPKKWVFSTNGMYDESRYKNDSLSISIGPKFGFIGIGKEFKLNDKLSSGISLHLGILRSKQEIIKTASNEGDIWSKYDENQFEQLTQLSPIKFTTQVEIFLFYDINKSLTFTTGFRNSIVPMNKVDNINDIQLYRNYFSPFLGIRLGFKKSG